jgi:hypothetical protein
LKHGSWLNIAEIELSVMTRQCFGKRIATIEELQEQGGLCPPASDCFKRKIL